MEQPDPTSFETHVMLPGWWVKAYEAAATAGEDGAGAMGQACAAGLAPALGTLELNALASLLGTLRAQLLAGRELVISSEEHLKHAGTAAPTRRFAFEKVAQILTGVRLLLPAADGALGSCALFCADRWTRLGSAVQVQLTLAPLGAELLLGLADAHLDLVRFARGGDQAGELLGAHAPLAVGRSTWLALAGHEQLLLLRLERAMQWEFRWLQLEGIFGLPMAELFAGVTLPAGRGAAASGLLALRLKALTRLGRKLAGHGFLAPAVADQYLALGGEGAALTLVWQVARERLGADTDGLYRAAVAAYMRRARYPEALDDLLRLCLPPDAGADLHAAARAAWARLATAETPARLTNLACRPSQPLLPQALFLEYLLRRQPAARFPLPEALRAGPVGELTASLAPGDLVERYTAFCRLVDDDAEFPAVLRDVPFATLASPATRAVKEFQAFAAAVLAPAHTPEPSAAVPAPPASAAPDAPKPRLVTPTAAPEEPQRSGAASGALASRMLKTASDELHRLRANDLERYQDLKRQYLASLDNTGRTLLLDVQKRIQATLFDEQLRQRLVRFMVDNPGAWRSADGPRTGHS